MYIGGVDAPEARQDYAAGAFYVADTLAELPDNAKAGDFAVVLDGLRIRIFDGTAWKVPGLV